MSKAKSNLLVVAHPDDESLFFAGVVLRKHTRPWKIICVTDGNADGQGEKRKKDFTAACRLLKIKDIEFWNYSDIFEVRLPVDELTERLRAQTFHQVYTHGPVGEYGHPHHQDVCVATYRAFKPQLIYAVAYNCEPDFVVNLTPKEFAIKRKILSEIYHSETQRFLNFVPATWSEGFCRFDRREIEAVYMYYTQRVVPPAAALKKYKWLCRFFEIHRDNPVGRRPF